MIGELFLNKMSIFTSSKNTFDGQLPGEKIILVTRRHWLFLFTPLFCTFLVALLPFIGYLLINSLKWYANISSLYWFLTTVILLILWNIAFYQLMIYSLNTIIVTDRRIVENKQVGLFKHTINELKLTKVQDISVKVFGPFAQLLDYGNIEVQSAGAVGKFFFNYFPHPKKIKSTIMGLKTKTD